jgi:hypothetical protein
MSRACSKNRCEEEYIKGSGGKSEGKRPLGIDSWEDNIKKELKRNEGYGLDSFGSGHGPLVGSCKHNTKPLGSKRSREILK